MMSYDIYPSISNFHESNFVKQLIKKSDFNLSTNAFRTFVIELKRKTITWNEILRVHLKLTFSSNIILFIQ